MNKNFLKLFAVVYTLVMIFALASCGKGEDNKRTETVEASSVSETYGETEGARSETTTAQPSEASITGKDKEQTTNGNTAEATEKTDKDKKQTTAKQTTTKPTATKPTATKPTTTKPTTTKPTTTKPTTTKAATTKFATTKPTTTKPTATKPTTTKPADKTDKSEETTKKPTETTKADETSSSSVTEHSGQDYEGERIELPVVNPNL